MTPRQQKLVDASDQCLNQARMIELDYPRSLLDDPMMPKMKRDIVAARLMDVAELRLASATIMVFSDDPEGYGQIVALRAKKRWAFDALVKLATDELARADDAPAGELAA